MDDTSDIKTLSESIIFALGLLKGNKDRFDNRLSRRNLKLSKKMYKYLHKDFFKHGGLDQHEKELLKQLKTNIVTRTLELKS